MTISASTHGRAETAGDKEALERLNVARDRIYDFADHSPARIRVACKTVIELAHLIDEPGLRARALERARSMLELVDPKPKVTSI